MEIEAVTDPLLGPTFSRNRAAVNPATTRISKSNGVPRTYFDTPGEYYLRLKSNDVMRVLVLNPQDEISANVLRTFDFVSANLVSALGHNARFIADRENFVREYFQTDKPALLLCGETLSLFSMLIENRFSLPVREVTFTGVWMNAGMLNYGTHNVLEVYLPDKEKWVLFDVNHGFVAKWMDAFELTSALRAAASSPDRITSEEFATVQLDLHYEVEVRRPINAADSRTEYSPEMLTGKRVRDEWIGLALVLYSGPGYWGGNRLGNVALSNKHDLYLSRFHSDKFLLEAQLRWQGNWDLDTVHVSPVKLKRILHDAYKAEISEQAWRHKLPLEDN